MIVEIKAKNNESRTIEIDAGSEFVSDIAKMIESICNITATSGTGMDYALACIGDALDDLGFDYEFYDEQKEVYRFNI